MLAVPNTRHVHPCCRLSQASFHRGLVLVLALAFQDCLRSPRSKIDREELEEREAHNLGVVKSVELVMYLTIHVAQEIELATAAGTEIGLFTAVGPEEGRVAAEGRDGSSAASGLLPMHCASVPLQGLQSQNSRSAEALFFNSKRSCVLFLLCFLLFSFWLFKLMLLPLLSFRTLVRFLSISFSTVTRCVATLFCPLCCLNSPSFYSLDTAICASHLQHERTFLVCNSVQF